MVGIAAQEGSEREDALLCKITWPTLQIQGQFLSQNEGFQFILARQELEKGGRRLYIHLLAGAGTMYPLHKIPAEHPVLSCYCL